MFTVQASHFPCKNIEDPEIEKAQNCSFGPLLLTLNLSFANKSVQFGTGGCMRIVNMAEINNPTFFLLEETFNKC